MGYTQAAVAAREKFPLARVASVPHRTHRVNHEFGGETEAGCDPRLTSRTADSRTDLGHGAAGVKKLRSCSSVDGAVDAAAAKHRLVGGVHDRVHLERRDVSSESGDALSTQWP